MLSILRHADGLLCDAGGADDSGRRSTALGAVLLIIVCFGPLYGASMGSFHLDSAERLQMVAYAAVKVPLLLAATTAVCLPAFFVMNTLLGLRDGFMDALAAIFSGQ